MTDFKTYIYQTASNKKFVYRCPHCNKGIMQVAEIKTVKDETNILSWNYTCPVCQKTIVSIEKDGCSCFKSVFPPMTQISDKEFNFYYTIATNSYISANYNSLLYLFY